MFFKDHKLYLNRCRFSIGLSSVLLISSLLVSSFPSKAISPAERTELQLAMPIESNEVAGWPQGPAVHAESAILMEANTGVILYAKNIHKQSYPASTTKLLTTLIAYEQCSLDEIVDFSHKAVFDTPYGSNHIAIDVGEQLTMEEALNAILIRSANEVSFAVAEHIADSDWEDFAPLMNKRATELGCLNTNFVNPNGLPDDNHYTTAYDLAMIGRAFFANDYLSKITLQPRLEIKPSERQPDHILDLNKMLLIPGKEYAYEYLLGCKTGYTDTARSSLVACAEKDGMKLISVVLKEESPYHYEDTINLFNYGFQNFQKVNVSQFETKYSINSNHLFYGNNDVFGDSKSLLSLNEDAYLILPATASLADTESTISYETDSDSKAAIISYTYHDTYVGSASIDFAVTTDNAYHFDTGLQVMEDEVVTNKDTSVIFINVIKVFLYILLAATVIGAIYVVIYVSKNYHFSPKNNRRYWLRARRKRRNHQQLMNENLRRKRQRQIAAAKKRQRNRRR